jgi:hypothetical protein
MSTRPVLRESIIAALTTMEEGTEEEITALIGDTTKEAVRKAIYRMRTHKSGKMVYVKRWIRKAIRGGGHTPVYALGGCTDAPPLVNLTRNEMAQRGREKHRMLINTRRAARDGSSLASNPFAQLIRVVGAQRRTNKRTNKEDQS